MRGVWKVPCDLLHVSERTNLIARTKIYYSLLALIFKAANVFRLVWLLTILWLKENKGIAVLLITHCTLDIFNIHCACPKKTLLYHVAVLAKRVLKLALDCIRTQPSTDHREHVSIKWYGTLYISLHNNASSNFWECSWKLCKHTSLYFFPNGWNA